MAIPNLVQHFMLALAYAGILIMLSVGLNFVYSVLKFSNFAHAEFVTLGMYFAWWFMQIVGGAFDDTGYVLNNIFLQAAFAFVTVGIIGILTDIFVFNKMREIKADATTLTVGSIGIGLVIRFALSMIFGALPTQPTTINESHFPTFLPEFLREDFYEVIIVQRSTLFGTQSIRLTGFQVYTIVLAIVIVILVDRMFKKTKFGIALRATSDNIELAQVTGIDTKRIIFWTWFLAAGITGFGAAWLRAEQGKFSNFDGFVWLLPIFAVAILGGVGSFKGGIIASFILAYSRQAALVILSEFHRPGGLEDVLNIVTFAPSYADGIGFVILIIVLLFRPQGISGEVEATRARV